MRAHAGEFCHVHETLGEDVVGDHALARGADEQGTHLGLHVSGKSGIRAGLQMERTEPSVRRNSDAALASFDGESRGAQGFDDRLEVVGAHVVHRDLSSGDSASHKHGAGFDAVGDHRVVGAAQVFDAFDGYLGRAGPRDLGPECVEKVGQIDYFRLFGGILDNGGSLGQNGGHHDIICPEYGGSVFAAHVHGGATEARGENLDIAAGDAHRGAKGFKAAQVKIDRAVADHATAGEGDTGFVFAPEERTEHANRSAHFADEFVGRLGADFFRLDDDRAAGAFHFAAERAEDGQHVVDVAEVGDAANDAALAREEGGGEYGEGGILRSADAHRAVQLATTVNENFIHGNQPRTAGHFHNRDGQKCPEICALSVGC